MVEGNNVPEALGVTEQTVVPIVAAGAGDFKAGFSMSCLSSSVVVRELVWDR